MRMVEFLEEALENLDFTDELNRFDLLSVEPDRSGRVSNSSGICLNDFRRSDRRARGGETSWTSTHCLPPSPTTCCPSCVLSAAGFLLGKALSIDSRALGRVVFYVFSPILVFNLLLHVELRLGADPRHDGLQLPGLSAPAGCWPSVSARLMRLERPVLMALIITVAFANTGNYGLPLVSFAFGPQALAFASLYFVTTSILFNTAGVLIASLGHMDFKTAVLGLVQGAGRLRCDPGGAAQPLRHCAAAAAGAHH